MLSSLKVLLVSSDPANRQLLKSLLEECHLSPVCCSTVRDARTRLARRHVPVVFCEAQLTDGSFRDLLGAADTTISKVVVTSRSGDTHEYVEAMSLGAFDYMSSPYRRSEVEWILSHVEETVGTAA